ncbi:hypothetical protein KC887_00260 [Candidatus Kaiserbacteria bacterium]|nr:hypothetical protein [Candidatus Kaiserbacteria bacterium]
MGKIIFLVNGKELTEDERKADLESRESLEDILASDDGRSGLVNAMRRDNQMYEHGGHESCKVPKHFAKEHSDWIKKNKLAGVTVLPDGKIQFAGPRNKEDYLKARGLADYSSAGSESRVHVAPKKIDRPSKKERKEKIRAAIKRIRESS